MTEVPSQHRANRSSYLVTTRCPEPPELLRFALQPLASHDLATLHAWRAQYLKEKITPILLPAAQALVEKHRARGDTLLIITATNRFVTEPIAAIFGIENLLATEPEMIAGRYTGEVSGVPCYREGKVERLESWLSEQALPMGESWCRMCCSQA